LIESYNAGSRDIEELSYDLIALSRILTDEQQSHLRENMTGELLQRMSSGSRSHTKRRTGWCIASTA